MVNFKSLLEKHQAIAIEHQVDTHSVETLLLDLMNWKSIDYLMHQSEDVPAEDAHRFEVAFARLVKGEPVQYIVGFQEFYGERFVVSKDCLIPRPETEEVTLSFLESVRDGDTVADTGTGSGAIAITLKRLKPDLNVIATDICERALKVAEDNAKRLEADITFYQGDVLKPLINQGVKLDGLISNPPYISRDEVEVMSSSVLEYEPESALFAANDGLLIYERILQDLPQVLKKGAVVVFEIGYLQGERLKAMIQNMYPSTHVQVLKDMNQNDRIIKFKW
ncbi:peptide chain release factor N(5)-glutamine methyltransferase [Staphylococcus massiliensis]|uniref:Release factor glutamine methyltransferase n=1 Tax=Staphylococcus massiliensis S46 TaxID=1229783 RepID=K9AIK7_9STAP|nr:peptide chain release factor N(5)-glutamine methyltransferase [Staphylococcus massiliensis]EKU47173.1 N5-glutamine S-adenosyl-L-methionine-dependent methyltransferase [Staphylococcus massiliensis S46]PNZ99823.1 peptide chain release factor N(5)-glutamine methyltransferase [Staphylococcus massiliensis CCUG 55927]